MQLPRIFRKNLVWLPGAVVVPSSEQPSFTREALQRQGVTDVLRFKVGWDVVTGVNDRIDFNRGGVKVATLTAGNYATAAAYAAAAVAALEAADSTPVWAASQDSSTGVWSISSDIAFTLLFGSGANKARSIAGDAGFDATDSSSATSQSGSRPAWQSRKWVNLDAGQDLGFWLIVEGVNDTLDVLFGGTPYAARIAAGLYDSGHALAVAVRAALEVAAPAAGWSVVYDGDTSTFVVSRTNPFDILTLTGANTDRSIAGDLGYDSAADHTGNSLYISDVTVTGSAVDPVEVAAILGHSLSDSATARLDAHTSSLVAAGLGTSVAFTDTLDRDPERRSDLRLAVFASARTERYWRLVIDDTLSGAPNDARSVAELGVWFLGTMLRLTGIAPELSDERDELSTITMAVEGAHSVVRRATRRVFDVRIHTISDDDKLDLEDFADEVRAGGAFFFTLDPDDPFACRFVFLAEGLQFQAVETWPRTWSVAMRLLEILG